MHACAFKKDTRANRSGDYSHRFAFIYSTHARETHARAKIAKTTQIHAITTQ